MVKELKKKQIMKTVFKKSTTNWGCYAAEKKQDNYIFKEDFTIEKFLATEIPLKDKGLFISYNCDLTNNQLREFAIGCALCVLPIYEKIYPGNNAPREAIEAAQKYLDGEIGFNELMFAKRVAYAAYDAVDDADAAAYTAAYTAYAAAAYTADYAAYDAAYTAAAAAAYGNPTYQQELLQFFKDFTS
jgi:hypothetical protein